MKSAAAMYRDLEPKSAYYDKHSSKCPREYWPRLELSPHEYQERLKTSTTLYVGNLSFFTLES